MNQNIRQLVELHWRLANERDWLSFESLLSLDLCYEVPQTREYIESGLGYLDMFRTWPGDWQVKVKQLVAEENRAICIIDFSVGEEVMTGISVFEALNGRLTAITDYWPEPYEPPPRVSVHMRRRTA